MDNALDSQARVRQVSPLQPMHQRDALMFLLSLSLCLSSPHPLFSNPSTSAAIFSPLFLIETRS